MSDNAVFAIMMIGVFTSMIMFAVAPIYFEYKLRAKRLEVEAKRKENGK